MKFIAVLATLFAGAYAQVVSIGLPTAGTTIASGNVLVQVDRSTSPIQSEEVAIVISIAACNSDGTCNDPSTDLGQTLYSGTFNPVYVSPEESQQQFTVSVPSYLAGQKALLSVVHLALVGPRPFPLYELRTPL